jgi:hypothetical protein
MNRNFYHVLICRFLSKKQVWTDNMNNIIVLHEGHDVLGPKCIHMIRCRQISVLCYVYPFMKYSCIVIRYLNSQIGVELSWVGQCEEWSSPSCTVTRHSGPPKVVRHHNQLNRAACWCRLVQQLVDQMVQLRSLPTGQFADTEHHSWFKPTLVTFSLSRMQNHLFRGWMNYVECPFFMLDSYDRHL